MGRTELDPRAVARVIAAYGFEALRGRRGTGSGAAPSHRLAELPLEGLDTDKRTVARKAARGLPPGAPPASTATPFDFAMAAQYDWSRNGGQASFQAALELIQEVFLPLGPDEYLDAAASLLRLTIQVEFDEPDSPFLTASGVEALALDYLRGRELRRSAGPPAGRAASEESLAWATWLIGQRRQESRQTSEGYEAVLTFLLLVLRRRPRQGYSIPQIVRALQSLWVGGMHRAFLEPELYPEYHRKRPPGEVSAATGLPVGDGQIERGMVDLIVVMTEESLFSVRRDDVERVVVADALDRYRTAEETVRLDTVLRVTGAEADRIRERFPTDGDLASACVRWLAGEWTGFESFAHQFRNAASAGVVILLEWVGDVRAEFPALLAAAGFAPGDPAFDEVVAFVSVVLGGSTIGGSAAPCPADVKRARACVAAAAAGGDWRTPAGIPAPKRPMPVA
jgi:hypothetical protein